MVPTTEFVGNKRTNSCLHISTDTDTYYGVSCNRQHYLFSVSNSASCLLLHRG